MLGSARGAVIFVTNPVPLSMPLGLQKEAFYMASPMMVCQLSRMNCS